MQESYIYISIPKSALDTMTMPNSEDQAYSSLSNFPNIEIQKSIEFYPLAGKDEIIIIIIIFRSRGFESPMRSTFRDTGSADR